MRLATNDAQRRVGEDNQFKTISESQKASIFETFTGIEDFIREESSIAQDAESKRVSMMAILKSSETNLQRAYTIPE